MLNTHIIINNIKQLGKVKYGKVNKYIALAVYHICIDNSK